MRATTAIVLSLMLIASPVAGTALGAADTSKTDSSKGLTVEDFWRSLKRAEQNIEKEIPKIGPAIVDAFKKITGKESQKQPGQTSEKQKK
jgi:Spy/CpxP family protein refolding chaperone